MYKKIICLLMLVMVSSCSYFQIRRPIIEQGNIITDEDVSQLHPGMSHNQVVEIMGTPVLVNMFTPDREEYIYTYKDRANPRIVKRLICLFRNGSLQSIQRSAE